MASNDFRSAFEKLGMVSSSAKGETGGRPVQPPAGTPASAGKEETKTSPLLHELHLEDYAESALRWGAAAVELLGEQRLLQLFERNLDGTGRGRDAFDSVIERAIGQKPQARAEEWRQRLPGLGGRKGVPTFEREAHEVLDALRSGAVAVWAELDRKQADEAAQLVWPPVAEGETEHVYSARLTEWGADKPAALLQRLGFEPWRIARELFEKLESARREAQNNFDLEVVRKAILEFDRSGDFSVLTDARREVKDFLIGPNAGSSPEYVAAEHPHWAWPCASAGHIKPGSVRVPPPPEWLDGLGIDQIDFLVKCVKEAHYDLGDSPRDFRPAFRQQLLKALPYRLDEGHVAIVAGSTIAVDHTGRVLPLYTWGWGSDGFQRSELREEQPGMKLSTTPSSDGWVTIRTVTTFDGSKSQATLYSPEQYRALQVANTCRRGSFDCRAWLGNFGRSPDKGFGRFYFRVQPGGAHSDQMFVSVDDRLRDRIELLKSMPDPEDVAYRGDIWRVPARLASRQQSRGHLVWDERAEKALVAWKGSASWVQMSRRSSGGYISHRATSTAAAWSLSASTNKHNHTMVVALIGEGQELHLESGRAIRCTGGELVEIAGGALTPEERLPQGDEDGGTNS